MNIAISNIAWQHCEDSTIVDILRTHGVNVIEIAPNMIWENPTSATLDAINHYRLFWNKNGISIRAAQAILYGHPELLLFKDAHTRTLFINYLADLMHILSLLGVEIIVFGSLDNRYIFPNIGHNEAMDIAIEAFFQIASHAQKYHIYFCIEPAPAVYKCNFINTTEEAIELIRLVQHPHFCLHLDSACLYLGQESYEHALHIAKPFLKHFHISEPFLQPIGKGGVDHKKLACLLREIDYSGIVSIEMKSSNFDKNLLKIKSVISYVKRIYG